MSDRLIRLFTEAKENKPIKIDKTFIVEIWDGTKIYLVNGEQVRDNGNVEFDLGGNYYGDKNPGNPTPCDCPKDEIWIEETKSPKEQIFLLVHELTEYLQMKYHKMTYEKAHPIANSIENAVRQMAKHIGDIK